MQRVGIAFLFEPSRDPDFVAEQKTHLNERWAAILFKNTSKGMKWTICLDIASDLNSKELFLSEPICLDEEYFSVSSRSFDTDFMRFISRHATVDQKQTVQKIWRDHTLFLYEGSDKQFHLDMQSGNKNVSKELQELYNKRWIEEYPNVFFIPLHSYSYYDGIFISVDENNLRIGLTKNGNGTMNKEVCVCFGRLQNNNTVSFHAHNVDITDERLRRMATSFSPIRPLEGSLCTVAAISIDFDAIEDFFDEMEENEQGYCTMEGEDWIALLRKFSKDMDLLEMLNQKKWFILAKYSSFCNGHLDPEKEVERIKSLIQDFSSEENSDMVEFFEEEISPYIEHAIVVEMEKEDVDGEYILDTGCNIQ